ncbi:MAG: thioredoxin domain-containing protein [Bacteroidetes bacterium]|nr:thioredoxin domain-containing protein [Bacteroidota bacterium]
MDTKHHKFTNHLIHESSPYLLQHAHNPVDWYPWNDSTLAKAKAENKMLLISIGYSACHWCHVMEHESFENEEVAKIMNEHYICIKVDREERPDIDQVYMNAVQLMTGSGGWPLNCFALPDGRPVYGGTYFPTEKWKNVLLNIADLFKNEPNKVFEYAAKLTDGIKQSELIKRNESQEVFDSEDLTKIYEEWSKRFDKVEGGPNRAPKFPLPNNYQFLLRYAVLNAHPEALAHVKLTLAKMAFGGIYDQLGGGFSRYSTDYLWKVPHFEKMGYDNAQLVSLYSEAFQYSKDPLYKQVVEETLEFVQRELTSAEGAFYSALDADSEGEEGKYYVWKKTELEQLLGADFTLFAAYFNINEIGFWEHGNYILLRKKQDEEIANQLKIPVSELIARLDRCKKVLAAEREKRVHPGLDDKILCSWNALMIKGYVDAYKVFNEPKYLEQAVRTANFICEKMMLDDSCMFHSYKNGKASINGFLEDYAFCAEAFIALYEASFDEKYLTIAQQLTAYSIAHFYDEESGFFFFTSTKDVALIARKMETSDNVIPASNSVMAKVLYLLGHYLDKEEYIEKAKQMLQNVKPLMQGYGAGYSNWAMLLQNFVGPYYEIAVVGEDAEKIRKELEQHFIPNKLLLGTRAESKLPLLEGKYIAGKTLIYVCKNKTCQRPVSSVKEALNQLH